MPDTDWLTPEERPHDDALAALAPTLQATAAILPWVKKPQPVRFPPELNKRWQDNCQQLRETWSTRLKSGETAIRPWVFRLLEIALETRDADCLALAEMLASVADRLEEGPASIPLAAALNATIEALCEPGGLENLAFPERSRHFTQRLKNSLLPSAKPGVRSDVLDQLFIHDSEERLERMHEALEVLPVDIYALQLESEGLVQHALEIEMWGMVHLSRQLIDYIAQMNEAGEREQERARQEIRQHLDLFAQALAAIEP